MQTAQSKFLTLQYITQSKYIDFHLKFNNTLYRYSEDYYPLNRPGSNTPQLIPLRWLACECADANEFTSQSDVWALAVTIWEVFDLCSDRPYSQLDDLQVLNNLTQMNATGDLMVRHKITIHMTKYF
jgi:hypothetical protein